MDAKLSSISKEVAVEMVKLSQKKGLRGSKGDWREFLNFYNKKTGISFRFSDPSRRNFETLVAFLNTLDKPEDLKFLDDACAAMKVSAFSMANKNAPDEQASSPWTSS